jgi:hypothetical protein
MKGCLVVVAGLLLSSVAAAQPAWPPAEPLRLGEQMAAVPSGPEVLIRSVGYEVQLERNVGTEWHPVCAAPCALTGDPAGLYRVTGVGMRESDPFRLQRSSGDTIVDVEGTSRASHNAGLALVIAGGGAALAGLVYWGLVSLAASGGPGYPYDPHEARVAWEGGLLLGSVGAVLEAVGIPLFLARTSVEVHQ